MKIYRVEKEKKRYLLLLLMADEQENMIDQYLERGEMYVMEEAGPCAVCVVTDEGDGVLEIKNLAVAPAFQRKGLGKAMIDFVAEKYRDRYRILQVGTGDSPSTIPFYEACGFVRSHIVPDFFTNYYDHPIYDGGVLLRDMVYLQRNIEQETENKQGELITEGETLLDFNGEFSQGL